MATAAAGTQEWEFAGFEAGGWLFIRLVLGVEWVRGALDKVGQPGWTEAPVGRAVGGFLQGAIAKSTEGPHPEVPHWYHNLVEQFFLPNAALLGPLVAYGEFLVGIALVMGLLVRLAALAGVTMNLAFLWAGTTSTNPPMLLLGLALVFFGDRAGRFGLDRWVLPWARPRLSDSLVRVLRFAILILALAAAAALALAVTDLETWGGVLAFALIVTIGATWRHRKG